MENPISPCPWALDFMALLEFPHVHYEEIIISLAQTIMKHAPLEQPKCEEEYAGSSYTTKFKFELKLLPPQGKGWDGGI